MKYTSCFLVQYTASSDEKGELMKNIQSEIDAMMRNGDVTSFKHAVEIRKELERQLEKQGEDSVDATPSITRLPSCPDEKKPVPNAILRSSLFSVIEKGARAYEKRVLKAAVNGVTVKFTGLQLDQSDLDVWLGCLHLLKEVPAGTSVNFSMKGFLKLLGKNAGKSDKEWLRDSLTRLSACLIEIGNGKLFYSGHLINEFYRDEVNCEYSITLNPKILSFFSNNSWTGLDFEKRKELKGKAVAKWLHGFYSTHSTPHPYKVETLKDLCGSKAELKGFRRILKKSLMDVSTITGWTYWIDESDLVNVKK